MRRSIRNLRWKASNAIPPVMPAKHQFPVCAICNRHVELETAKVDEDGQAMHEECYVLKLRLQHSKSA